MNCNGIGARDNKKLRVGACINCRFYPVNHFLCTHNLFAWSVAAALGAHLVFQVASRRAELDQAFNGAGDVKRRRAEAGIDVDHERYFAHIGNAAHVG